MLSVSLNKTFPSFLIVMEITNMSIQCLIDDIYFILFSGGVVLMGLTGVWLCVWETCLVMCIIIFF